MLLEESVWIGNHIKTIVNNGSYPILNIGSSTKEYRTSRQSFIQENIFNLINDEKNNVVHLDMKAAEGVDLVGDLYDSKFLDILKQYKFKAILLNNILMYLDQQQRIKLSLILEDLLDVDGYLIVTNSHVFPPAHDPVESYYRASPNKLYLDLFSRFNKIDEKNVEANYSFDRFLKDNPKIIKAKIIRFLCPFYQPKEWLFMLEYYRKNLKKNYSASCLFLQKKSD